MISKKTTSKPTSEKKVMYSCDNGYNLVSNWDVLRDMQRRLSDLSLIDQTSIQYVETNYSPFALCRHYPWKAYVPIWGCSHTKTKTTLTMEFAIIDIYADQNKGQVYSPNLEKEESHSSYYSTLNFALKTLDTLDGNYSLEISPSSNMYEYQATDLTSKKYASLEQYKNGKQNFSAPLGTLEQTQPLFEMMEDMISKIDGNLDNILRPGYVGWFSSHNQQ